MTENISTSEEWRCIPGLHHEASSLGRIRNPRTGHILKCFDDKGYHCVGIYHNKQPRPMRVNRLVAMAFHGEPEPGMVCRHLDGDRQNNRPENLQWGTTLENGADRRLHGSNRGHRNSQSKLNDDAVREIRRLCSERADRHKIADSFGVCAGTIGSVATGRTWTHVPLADEQGSEAAP